MARTICVFWLAPKPKNFFPLALWDGGMFVHLYCECIYHYENSAAALSVLKYNQIVSVSLKRQIDLLFYWICLLMYLSLYLLSLLLSLLYLLFCLLLLFVIPFVVVFVVVFVISFVIAFVVICYVICYFVCCSTCCQVFRICCCICCFVIYLLFYLCLERHTYSNDSKESTSIWEWNW